VTNVKISSISVPEYTLKDKPDYIEVGNKVDSFVAQNFLDGKYVVRAISSDDHPEKTLDELIDTILKLGTDRYDPNRKSVAHEDFSVYDYDFHASEINIKNGKIVPNKTDEFPTSFGSIVYNFYENAPIDRGYPVRIDLLLLYDPNKLEKATKLNSKSIGVGLHLEEYLYKFKDRQHKANALVGIVKILK
jgi:hypothetical protein